VLPLTGASHTSETTALEFTEFFWTFSIVRYSKKTRRFGNWICFRPQVKVGEKTPSQLGSLERADLNHWTAQLSRCLLPHLHLRTETDSVPETSCFFGIPDDGKSLEKFCEFCTTYTIVRILSSLTTALDSNNCTVGIFTLLTGFHSSALQGDRGAACREAHTNFADESACLTADNVRNEVVNNSQFTGGFENAVPLHVDIFQN
jgi:hypothetical protein